MDAAEAVRPSELRILGVVDESEERLFLHAPDVPERVIPHRHLGARDMASRATHDPRIRRRDERASRSPLTAPSDRCRAGSAGERRGRKQQREPISTDGLLRAVREALRIPVAEIAEKSGAGRLTLHDFEMRELKRTITLKSLGRIAEAMGCKVVYGVVPLNGRTFEYVAEERLWKKVLRAGNRDQGTGIRKTGSGD